MPGIVYPVGGLAPSAEKGRWSPILALDAGARPRRTRGLSSTLPQIHRPPPVGPLVTQPADGEHVYGDVEVAWTAPPDPAQWGEVVYDLQLSLNGGATWPITIASSLSDAEYAGDLTLYALGNEAQLRVRSRVGDHLGDWVTSNVFVLHPETPRWDLTIFGDDGLPLLGSVDGSGNIIESSFSTHPAHPRPWLQWPKEAAGSEVDFLKGKIKIGQFNVAVVDKRSVATDQSTGQITALLGAYEGLNGLRNVLTFTPVNAPQVQAIDGPLVTPKMHGSFAGYEWGIQDENKRTRKVRAFDRTGTTCIFPRGPLEPYGLLPTGQYAVPAADVFLGTYEGDATQGQVWAAEGASRTLRVLTEAMREAARFVWDESVNAYVLEHATVRWRPASGGAWTTLERMPAYQFGPLLRLFGRSNELFRTRKDDIRVHDPDGEERVYRDVSVIRSIRLRAGVGALPANGQQVHLQVIYTGPATKDYPLHFDGTAGDFLKACLDGDYCSEPLGTRYNTEAIDAFVQQCTARITEPTDDLLGWLEKNWYQPLCSAPTLDEQGRIAPRLYLLPDETEELLTLTDANCKPDATWSHPEASIINEPTFVYFRDVAIDVRDDPTGEFSAGDRIWTREIRIKGVEDPADPVSHNRVGAKPHEIKTALFRAVGRQDGSAASGEATTETGHVLGKERVNQAIDRFILGAQAFSCVTLRSHTGALKLGDWVEVGVSWLPDYIANTRGMNRVAQVIGIKDIDPITRTLLLQDGGDALAPLARPTIGVAAENAEGGIDVPVTAVIAGTEALVEYAISLTEPAHDSKLWTPAGRTKVPATISTPPLPANASVYIGARSILKGRRPSLRTTPVQHVFTSNTPRLTNLKAEADEETGEIRVTWDYNGATLGVRLYYIVQATEGTEEPVDFMDVDASLGEALLPVTVVPGQLATIDGEGWTGWDGSAVTGVAGPQVRVFAGLGKGPVFRTFEATNPSDGVVRISVTLSASVVRYRLWRRYEGDPKDGGADPLDLYALGGDREPTALVTEFASIAGEYTIVGRAYDADDNFQEVTLDHTASGDLPTTIGTPVLGYWNDPSAFAAGYRALMATWANTRTDLAPVLERYVNGVAVTPIPLLAFGDSDYGNAALEEWLVPWGDRASVRVGYSGYPMSGTATLDVEPDLAPNTGILTALGGFVQIGWTHPAGVPGWASDPAVEGVEFVFIINGVPSVMVRRPGNASPESFSYLDLGVNVGDTVDAMIRYHGGTYDVAGVWSDPYGEVVAP